jgi:hypothetical protein
MRGQLVRLVTFFCWRQQFLAFFVVSNVLLSRVWLKEHYVQPPSARVYVIAGVLSVSVSC